jgi:hypothetical protein
MVVEMPGWAEEEVMEGGGRTAIYAFSKTGSQIVIL